MGSPGLLPGLLPGSLLVLLVLAPLTCAPHAPAVPVPVPVPADAELTALYAADQADRAGAGDALSWAAIDARDADRRARVAALLGEPC